MDGNLDSIRKNNRSVWFTATVSKEHGLKYLEYLKIPYWRFFKRYKKLKEIEKWREQAKNNKY